MERDFSITPLLVNHQAHPGKNNWVKIFIYEPAEPEVLQSRGTMYAVLSLSAKAAIDFTPIMQTILEELHTQYFQQTSGSILQSLEKALDNIHKKLILLGQEDKRLADEFNFNLLTAVSWGTVLYFGQLGASRAALLRDGKLFDIDEGEQKSTNLYLSSGVLQSQDRIILGTNQLFRRFNRTSLKKILSLPQEKIVAGLEGDLDPGPDRQSQSAIVLIVDIKQVPSLAAEGLQIADPSNPEVKPIIIAPPSTARRRQPNWLSLPGQIIPVIRRLFGWKIGSFIPVVPMLLAIGAVAALLLSLNGGQDWQPQFGPNQALVASATNTLSQAEEVADVNPDRALDLLNQAEKYIQEGLTDYPQNQELSSLQSRLDNLKQQILIITKVSSSEIAKVTVKPTQTKLVFNQDGLFLIDAQKQELVRVSPKGEVEAMAADFRFAEGALLANTTEGLMVSSRGQGVSIDSGGSIGQSKQLPDTIQPVSITGFISNGYILDAAGQIYRLPQENNEIGSISTYFERAIGGSTLVDVAVDGNIYLLRQDGTIDVYLNGEKQPFTLERSALANHSRAMFTSPESDKIFLLQESSILVWNKQGKYLGQVQLKNHTEKWQMATVDDQGNTLYILADNALLKADLP